MKPTPSVLAALVLALAAPARATLTIQKRALEVGQAAGNCGYCHTFDSDHMKREAKAAGLPWAGMNCITCHGDALPKTGPRLLNHRGSWLAAEKRRLGAEKVDAAWLKAYVAPSPTPAPRKSPGSGQQ